MEKKKFTITVGPSVILLVVLLIGGAFLLRTGIHKKEQSLSIEKTAVITSPTTQEQVLLEEINGSSGEQSDEGEGRGIFDPSAEYEPVFDMELIADCNKVWDRVFPNKKIGKKLFSMKTKTDELKIFKALDDLIEKNKDLEYEVWGDKKLLGNGIVGRYIDGVKIIPFPELWDSFYEESVKTEDQLVRLCFMLAHRRALGFETGVKGYKGRNDQIERVMESITIENYKDMRNRVQGMEQDDHKDGSSNFVKLLDKFGTDDTQWIDAINEKIGG